MNLAPLFPIVEDDYCRDHDSTLPCVKCAADDKDKADYRYAMRLERQAKVTREIVVNNPEDRGALMQWADSLEKRASQIFGRLQREADAEARQIERERKT